MWESERESERECMTVNVNVNVNAMTENGVSLYSLVNLANSLLKSRKVAEKQCTLLCRRHRQLRTVFLLLPARRQKNQSQAQGCKTQGEEIMSVPIPMFFLRMNGRIVGQKGYSPPQHSTIHRRQQRCRALGC
jgi:hypothetical protein